MSPVSGGSFLSTVFNGGLLSLVPPAGSPALFLTSTSSRAHCSSLSSSPFFHSFLPSLPTPLTRNPAPLTGKRLFDQAFITQRPISLIRQQEELDFSFGQCSYSVSIKMNRSWQCKLYDPKPVCLLESITLLSLLFWDDSFVPCTRHIVLLAKKWGLTAQHVNNAAIKERMGTIWQNETISKLDTLFAGNSD